MKTTTMIENDPESAYYTVRHSFPSSDFSERLTQDSRIYLATVFVIVAE